jgi:hypothetical protein
MGVTLCAFDGRQYGTRVVFVEVPNSITFSMLNEKSAFQAKLRYDVRKSSKRSVVPQPYKFEN